MLKGKTAVITGCIQGIGRATLDLFAENGAVIFACAQHETDEFAAHIAELSQRCNTEIIPVYFDFGDEASVKQAAGVIQKTKRPVDILVNVAGITSDALFQMVTMDNLRKIFEINFFSQILFTQYITKLMLRAGTGSVINISSIAALDGNPGQLAYASSKAAIIAATKTMSMELAPRGIRVNCIAPGVIDTAMTAQLPEEAMTRQMARSDLKRTGNPSEVAGVLLFLASDSSAYITGQIVRVDGGIG